MSFPPGAMGWKPWERWPRDFFALCSSVPFSIQPGTQLGLPFLNQVGADASQMSGAAMAVAIGYALHCPPLVLFSLVPVGFSANTQGGAGGPLAILIIAFRLRKQVKRYPRKLRSTFW